MMLFEDNKILEFIQHQKFNQGQFIIYADVDCITEKIEGSKINLKIYL